MSTFLEGPPEGVIGTSTALIVSPDFKKVLFAPHKIGKLMPLGGKVELERDGNLFEECLWRELNEEGGVQKSELEPMDSQWHPIFWTSPVKQFPYHLRGKKALDALYLFVMKNVRAVSSEKQCEWIDMKDCLEIMYGLSPHRLYLGRLMAKRKI